MLQNSGQLTAQPSPYQAIRQAASETGTDFDYLWRTAKRESGLDPSARASTSSATGLFQFTNQTWLSMVERYGDKYGLENVSMETAEERKSVLALREDPVTAARMAGELAKENAAILSNLIDREATPQELYAAHFLGPSGAAKLINTARDNPTMTAEDIFPAAASANPAIFNGHDGAPRSVAAVYARLTGDVISAVDANPASGAVSPRYSVSGLQGQGWAQVEPSSLNAEEQLQKAKASRSLMAALIGLHTTGEQED